MDALKSAQHKVTEPTTGADEHVTKVVNTVDHRSPAGDKEATTTEPIEIVHIQEDPPQPTKDKEEHIGTTGDDKSVLDKAKEAASKTVDSAKSTFSSGEKEGIVDHGSQASEMEVTSRKPVDCSDESETKTDKSVFVEAKETFAKTLESAKAALTSTDKRKEENEPKKSEE